MKGKTTPGHQMALLIFASYSKITLPFGAPKYVEFTFITKQGKYLVIQANAQ